MPDPANAHARRGAEFTFDGEAFLQLVKRLTEPLTDNTPTISAPSFDHAIKDPKENDIPVERTHRIVVLEGNCESSARPTPRQSPGGFLSRLSTT